MDIKKLIIEESKKEYKKTIKERKRESFVKGAEFISSILYTEDIVRLAYEAGIKASGTELSEFEYWFQPYKKR